MKKKPKIFLRRVWILLFIFIATLGLAGICWWYKNSNERQKIYSENKWQNYTDAGMGFSLLYPPGWEMIDFGSRVLFQPKIQRSPNRNGVEITIWEESGIEKAVEKIQGYGLGASSRENISIDGVKGVRLKSYERLKEIQLLEASKEWGKLDSYFEPIEVVIFSRKDKLIVFRYFKNSTQYDQYFSWMSPGFLDSLKFY